MAGTGTVTTFDQNTHDLLELRRALQMLRLLIPASSYNWTGGDPGPTDDITKGWKVGSKIIRIDAASAGGKVIWQCADNTENSAVWQRMMNATVGKTTVPGASDDDYQIGTIWVDETNDKAFVLLDNTPTAAVWKEIGLPIPGMSTAHILYQWPPNEWRTAHIASVLFSAFSEVDWDNLTDPGQLLVSAENIGLYPVPAPTGDDQVLTSDSSLGWKMKWAAPAGGATDIDDLTDVDTTTDPPNTNDVLKWNGSQWVPAPYDYSFAFSMDSFSDGISDTSQLIGSGTWLAVGAISFTATYSNPPVGMTAWVAMSGSSVAWADDLDIDPTTGPEVNTEAVAYPSSATGTITFTLHQSADGTTLTDYVSFSNTMRYGNSAAVAGAQTEATLEALTEVGGPNESRTQTINNIPTTAAYLVFAHADRLSSIQQVQRNAGFGYVTCSFNATRTSVAPSVQTGVANVTNSAGFSESFECITSTDTGLANGTNDFQLVGNTTAINYIYWGELNKASGYTEADVEGNYATQPGKVGSNSMSSRSMTVNCGAGEYAYIAYPARLGALTSIIIGGFESLTDFNVDNTALSMTNPEGFQEDYRVYVSKNPGFTNPTTMTVSI